MAHPHLTGGWDAAESQLPKWTLDRPSYDKKSGFRRWLISGTESEIRQLTLAMTGFPGETLTRVMVGPGDTGDYVFHEGHVTQFPQNHAIGNSYASPGIPANKLNTPGWNYCRWLEGATHLRLNVNSLQHCLATSGHAGFWC